MLAIALHGAAAAVFEFGWLNLQFADLNSLLTMLGLNCCIATVGVQAHAGR